MKEISKDKGKERGQSKEAVQGKRECVECGVGVGGRKVLGTQEESSSRHIAGDNSGSCQGFPEAEEQVI